MPVAYADAIRRAADLLIGENLTCPHVLCPGLATPVEHKGVAPRCESRDWRSRPPKKHTSKITKSCVLHANEQKRSIFASPLYRGLCVGSDVTDGALLRGSSREPVSGAPPEIVCSRRAVDRAPRPKGGRGNRRDWAYCHSGPSRVRRAIFGRIASARRGDSRLSTKAERVLRARAFPSGEMKRESPQQVYHNRCYILTRTKCELERTYEKGASLMRAGRLRRRRLRTSRPKRRLRKSNKSSTVSPRAIADDHETAEVEPAHSLLLSSLRFWEVKRDLIEERMTAIGH
jgi:hypothetical protein